MVAAGPLDRDPPNEGPPPGFATRRPTENDLDELVELYNAVARQRGLALVGPDLIRSHRDGPAWWEDALVISREGDPAIVAYAHFTSSVDVDGELDLWIDGRVHPEAAGEGLASFLIHRGERRALQQGRGEHAHARVALRTTNDNGNDRARALYERLGFVPIRHRLAMHVEVSSVDQRATPQPWGVDIRTIEPERDLRPMWSVMQAGFADHHGFEPTDFETWRWVLVGRHDDFDPTMWLLATADGQAVGGLIAEVGVPEDPGMGHIRDLAVLPNWRRRGVAMGLLRRAFRAFDRRGVERVGLDVDDIGLGGATKLYEKAGMSVSRRIDIYEKELRPPLI